MAIPQDGLGSEQVQQLEAYEATAKVAQDPALAEYVDREGLKRTMEEVLGAVLDGGVSALASDQSKLREFVEAVKTEASEHGLSTIEAKVEAELQRIGTGAGAGSASGSGGGGGEQEHHEEESSEHHEEESSEQEGEQSGEGYA